MASNNIPQITSNMQTNAVLMAQRHAGTSHGYSVIALMMLDKDNHGFTVDVTFETIAELNSAADQMFGVWERCESNKVLFRSYRINGTPTETYNNISMTDEEGPTSSPDEFKNQAKVIVDIYSDETNEKLVYKFYRLNESKPRVLTLKLSSL